MKQKVYISYSPGVPGTYQMELNIDLKGQEWTRDIEIEIREELSNKFYEKAANERRGAEHRFFHRADGNTNPQTTPMIAQAGDEAVPQDQLDSAAQKIFDNILAQGPRNPPEPTEGQSSNMTA